MVAPAVSPHLQIHVNRLKQRGKTQGEKNLKRLSTRARFDKRLRKKVIFYT